MLIKNLRHWIFLLLMAIGTLAHAQEALPSWISTDGKTTQSEFVRLEGETLVLRKEGKEFSTPLGTLSPASQKQARNLSVSKGPITAVQKNGDDTLVGINYFAGWWEHLPNKWHGGGWDIKEPDWRPKFPDRVPILGEYNTQETMDREIAAAAEHGVDFFVILWYYPMPGSPEETHAPRMNRGLETFLASPNSGKMKFFIEHCNGPNFSPSSEAEWESCLKTWVAAMKHPSYLRVDGRLAFKIHNIDEFLSAHKGDIQLCRKRLDSLRAAVRQAGLGEMIIGCGITGESPPMQPDWAHNQLFDFTMTYMLVPPVEKQTAEHPYATLAEFTRIGRERRAADPIPWVPYVAAGWNPRPWTYPTAPDHYHRFFAFPTRSEFTAELRTVEKALLQFPTLGFPRKDGTRQRAFTIYAWNEFGEGGIVAPTKKNGHMMLECIKEVFGANSSSGKTANAPSGGKTAGANGD